MALQPPMPPGPQPMGGPPPGVPGMPPKLAVPQVAGAAAPGAKPGPPGAPGQPGQSGEGENELAPRLGFWQLPWVQNVLPFVTSLGMHAVIIILGLFAAQAIIKTTQILKEDQTIIPEATLADAGPPGGVPNVGTGGDPFKQAMQDTTPDGGTPEGWAGKAGPSVDPAAAGGGSGDAADSSGVIGLGVGGMGAGKGLGSGSGTGTGGGSGDGSGPLAMFGTPGGGAIGPKGPVFGNGGNAKRIVFVCDATGSMINKMATLKNELNKAISGLKPIQSFNIIFYYDGPRVYACDPGQLLVANSDNKRKAYKFLDEVSPTGQTNPIPALEMAFKQAPDLVYLLSDGGLDDNLVTNKEVTDAINKSNPNRKIKMNTIMFDSFVDTAEEVMKQIAKDNGGSYRYVKESDLAQ